MSAPTNKLPRQAVARWHSLRRVWRQRLLGQSEDVITRFLNDVAARLADPQGRQPVHARVWGWIEGEVLPSAPVAIEILSAARQFRLVKMGEIAAALDQKDTTP